MVLQGGGGKLPGKTKYSGLSYTGAKIEPVDTQDPMAFSRYLVSHGEVRFQLVGAWTFRHEIDQDLVHAGARRPSQPTHYHQRNSEKPFHLDYCFIPHAWVPHVKAVQVGKFDDWRAFSDHVPLIVDVLPPPTGL